MPEPTVELHTLTDANRDRVLALRVAPHQEEFVSGVADSLEEAEESPEGNPWYRAVYADGRPVGFVMLSWDVTPDPPDILGPWFLWKLLIDRDEQGKGYGRATVLEVARIVREAGGTELLTSHVEGEGGPAEFYRRLGFVPTGERDSEGEIILRLPL